MRLGAVGGVAQTEEQVKLLFKAVTKVSHNHKKGLKVAESVAKAIFLARQGKSKAEIKQYIKANYYWLDFTIDQIRPT